MRYVSYARLLQVIGEGMKRVVGDQIWSTILEAKEVGRGNIVIDDVRFPVEVAMIHRHGGMVIRVIRSGIVVRDGRILDEENVIDELDVDETVCNDGTIEDLSRRLLGLM